MGETGEGQVAHQQKSMDIESLKKFRDRFDLPLTDEQVENLSFYKPADDSPEMKYMAERRAAMGGFVPQRRRKGNELTVPELSAFENMLLARPVTVRFPPPWRLCASCPPWWRRPSKLANM